jgi:hypothetical protein
MGSRRLVLKLIALASVILWKIDGLGYEDHNVRLWEYAFTVWITLCKGVGEVPLDDRLLH